MALKTSGDLNMISLNVINASNVKIPSCVSDNKENNNLVALTLSTMSSEIFAIYYFIEIGGSMLHSKKRMLASSMLLNFQIQ